MKRTLTVSLAMTLLLLADVARSQVPSVGPAAPPAAASRLARQQDKNFRWDPILRAWVREVPLQTGLDAHNGLGDASPVDITNNASAPQFTRANDSDQTNSRIDDYINQDEQINVDDQTGTLKVLRVNQKRLVNDYVSALVPLKNVHPREMRGVFRNVCGKEGGFADVLQDPNTKENWLQVVCPEFQLPYVMQALHDLDEAWVKENYDGRAHAYYKPRFRDAGPLLNVLQFFRGPMETFYHDVNGNAIQFTGQPAVIFGLFPYGTKMTDIPPNQINLDVAIYEVEARSDVRLGLDWVAWKNGVGRDLFEFVAAGGPSYIGHFRWANLHAVATSAYIDFLVSKGKARLVTRNSLTAKTGSLAEMAAVDQVVAFNIRHNPDNSRFLAAGFADPPLANYLPGPSANIPGVTPAPLETAVGQAVGFKEDAIIPTFHDRVINYMQSGTVGVFMGVVPFVGLDSAELQISLHLTDLNGYGPQGQPLIDHKYVESVVRVFDGRPFVLSGLRRDSDVKAKNGVPFLSDLPVLGWLFGGESNARRETDVIVVVTPRFDVSSESKIEQVETKIKMTEDQELAARVAAGEADIPLPKNRFGFDQWLMDALDQ